MSDYMQHKLRPTLEVWVSLKAKRNSQCRYHIDEGCCAKELQVPTQLQYAERVGLAMCVWCERRVTEARLMTYIDRKVESGYPLTWLEDKFALDEQIGEGVKK